MKKLIIPAVLLSLLLCACALPGPAAASPGNQRVIRVQLLRCRDGLEQSSTDEQTLQAVLDCLRLMAEGPAAPESAAPAAYRLTLVFSDGSTREYVQATDGRFRDGRIWRTVPPEAAQILSGLFAGRA